MIRRHTPVFSFYLLAPLLTAAVWACGARAQDALPAPGKAAADEVQPAAAEVEAPAWLGILMEVARNQDLDEDEKPLPGVGVLETVEGGPARKAGLRQFDRVLKLDGKVLKDAEDLRTTVRTNKPGKEVKLRILRDGKEQEVKVTLEAMPPQQNLLVFQGAANPQLKPDRVQFFNRPPRSVEESGPDVIMLADGNRLEGKVLSVNKTDLELMLKSGGKVSLLMGEILSVRLAGEAKARKLPVGVLLRDGGWLAAALVTFKEHKFTLVLGDGGKLELDRTEVAEMAFSHEETPVFGRGSSSGDAWKPIPENSWVRNDGVWQSRLNQSAALGRKFTHLPAALEFSFDATAPGDWGGMVSLFSYRLDDGGGAMAPGMVQLSTGGRTVGLNHFDGQRFYNLQAVKSDTAGVLPTPEPGKPAHYAVFCDRVKGLLVLQVDGLVIGRYDIAKIAPDDLERAGGVISFRGQAGFNVANPTVRPWYGWLPKPQDGTGETDQVIVADQKVVAGEVTKITDTGITLASGVTVPRSKPLLLKFRPTATPAARPADSLWLEMKDGSTLAAQSVVMANSQLTIRTSFAGTVTLPMTALRRLSPARPDPAPVAAGRADVLTFADGRQLTGTYLPPMTGGLLRWKIPAARSQLEFAAEEVTSLCLSPRSETPEIAGQVIRLRNGDWLPGEVTAVDDTAITFKTPFHPGLRFARADIQSLFPAPGASVVADTASGRNRWLQASGRNSNQITLIEPDDAKAPAYSYADGAYTMRSALSDASGLRDGIVLALAETPGAVSMEFTCSGFDNYLAMMLLDQKAAPAFYLNFSGTTVVVSRAARPVANMNQMQIIRPEQFTFQLPPKTVLGSAMRVQIVPDPKARALSLAVNGRKVGTCRLKKEEPWVDIRYAMFSPTSMNGRRFSVGEAWVAPWNGRLGPAEAHAAGDVSLFFANGDETVARLVKLTGDAVEVDSPATGPLTLPLARIVAMDFNPPAPPEPATHRIRLYDRGQLSASAVRIGGQDVTLTTALGELTLPLSLIREITFPKK